jgi:hypothetical protein
MLTKNRIDVDKPFAIEYGVVAGHHKRYANPAILIVHRATGMAVEL